MSERLTRRGLFKKGFQTAAALTIIKFPFLASPENFSENHLSLFDKLMAPFISEAEKRRQKRLETEPEFEKRIDWELNEDRINFLLFGFGETYEPPFEKIDLIGSQTIFSYHLKRKEVDLVSITHDTRAPELERVWMAGGGQNIAPIRISHAYWAGGEGEGGFNLQRQVLESATGLSVDFQIVFPDEAIVDLVDKVFGKIKVQVPKAFGTNPIYIKGQRYESAEFNEGLQDLNGVLTVQFIKSVAKEDGKPDPQLEHNARKPRVIAGILKETKENAVNPFFWRKVLDYLNQNQIKLDFDPRLLLLGNIRDLMGSLFTSFFDQTELSVMPKIGRKVYIVDKSHGDGGVQWVRASNNPIIQEEIRRGVYIDLNMEVPNGGDPYAEDLVTGYWFSVRKVIKEALRGLEPTVGIEPTA